jgi:hypothetical protein
MCSVPNFLIAFLLWAFFRISTMRELPSDGAKRISRANRLDGGCCGQSETASSLSREGPPRDQAHREDFNFDSKQMRGSKCVFLLPVLPPLSVLLSFRIFAQGCH